MSQASEELTQAWVNLLADREVRKIFAAQDVEVGGRQVQNYFRTLQQMGKVRRDASVDVIAWMITGALIHFRMLQTFGPLRVSESEFLKELAEAMAAGTQP